MEAPRDRWDLSPPPGEAPPRPEGPAVRTLQRLLGLPARQARTAAYLLAAAALGIALMGLPELLRPEPTRPASGTGVPGPTATVPAGALAPAVPPEADAGAHDLERELEAMLNLMDGVGNVRVFVAYEQGTERVVAVNETRERRSSPLTDGGGGRAGQSLQESRVNRQVVVVRDNEGRREMPVVLVERYPVVRGVMVVADGARDPSVRLAIQRAVSAALHIPPHRISVYAKRR